jgi:hypothetical protein
MAIGIQGSDGTAVAADSIHDALRVTLRPSDVAGSYRLAAVNATGVAAGAGAAAEAFAVRNPSATLTAVIRKVTLTMHTGATGFTAGISTFQMKVARAFTAAPTAGTTVTLTGNNCKMATSHSTPVLTAFINDDSVLTSGTEVADDTAIGIISAATSNATNAVHINRVAIYDARDSQQPLVLKENEGFIIYATVPATGVWFHTVEVEWDEYLNADFPVS